MDNKGRGKISGWFSGWIFSGVLPLILILSLGIGFAFNGTLTTHIDAYDDVYGPAHECEDGIDNDGDTLTDFPNDPGCTSANDPSELGTVECDDGIDNDSDTQIDFPDDSGCTSPTDNSEFVSTGGGGGPPPPQPTPTPTLPATPTPTPTEDAAQCSDELDNDGDGLIDLADPGCTGPDDDTEAGEREDAATTVTIRYQRDRGRFKGAIGSSKRRCQVGRGVILKKIVRGAPNRVVGQTTSNRFGNWKIRKPNARGRFYAVAAPKRFENAAGTLITCLRDRSVTINPRRRR